MTAIMREPYAGVSFAESKARPERQCSLAEAHALAERLATARQRLWFARQPAAHLEAQLAAAWEAVRLAQALLSADKPPAEHRRVERVVLVGDRRYLGAEDSLGRFMQDRAQEDATARVVLASFADELREYVSDPAERADLPCSRELARMLRDRGITVARVGGVIYAQGVRLLDQDKIGYSPIRDSHSSRRSDSTRERPSDTAMSQRRGR
jgi:hypothetical protein